MAGHNIYMHQTSSGVVASLGPPKQVNVMAPPFCSMGGHGPRWPAEAGHGQLRRYLKLFFCDLILVQDWDLNFTTFVITHLPWQ